MKKIALMDTSVFTYNLGDQIIMDSVKKELLPLFEGDFIVNIPTHTPICHFYEYLCDKIFRKNNVKLGDLSYKFVCGTNLLTGNMLKIKNNWNINWFDSLVIKNCILVGVGHNINSKKVNIYTKCILKKVLDKRYVHSVRDQQTKNLLDKIGIKSINTGCCTLWRLTQEHCKQIKHEKSDKVVFTLTDYNRDIKNDQILIDTLNNNYDEVFFWPQGLEDFEYLHELNNIDKIKIINPTLKAYDEFLEGNECDYVGTRLHGGIRALQKKRRTIILSIDNRARNMGKDYNLNCIERDDINELSNLINTKFSTDVRVDYDKIEEWKKQFI